MARSQLALSIGLSIFVALSGEAGAATCQSPICIQSGNGHDPAMRLAQAASPSLQANIDQWLAVSDRMRSSGALLPGRPMPDALTAARAAFETSWRNAGLADRQAVPHAPLGRALAALVRSYRFQEYGNPDPKLALYWADEMIKFYEQVAIRRELAEAMLEKAAIYLQVSQLNHTDRNRFNQLSLEGDKLLQDCMAVAEDDQRVEILRYWSRFYYNLARPPSGRLSDPWDDRFLQLADQRIDGALKREPDSLKNLNQKARVTQRRARATLDAPSAFWAIQLSDVQNRLAEAWRKADSSINRPEDRLSPLNVLAMTTLDAVMYSILVSDDASKTRLGPGWLKTIDEVGLPAQLNAWAIVRNTELARSYGFDTVYDLSRLYALRAILSGLVNPGRQNEDIEKVISFLHDARELATVPQLDAAKQSLAGDTVFVGLPDFARADLKRVLEGTTR